MTIFYTILNSAEAFITAYSIQIATVFYVAMAVMVTIHVLLNKEDVRSSIGWIGLAWLSPMLGGIIYIIFGINRVRRKAVQLNYPSNDSTIEQLRQKLAAFYKEIPQDAQQFLRLGYKVQPWGMTINNSATPYINGDNAYPVMAEIIARAKKEVLVSSYIFNYDAAGKMFEEAFKKASANGAKIKVLADGVGTRTRHLRMLEKNFTKIKNLEFAVFLPPRINLPFVNLRNHRKMLVVDGSRSFFGGMNIAECNMLASVPPPPKPVQDVTFKIEGRAVQQIAEIFREDWLFATGRDFIPAEFDPALAPEEKGNVAARLIPDGPDNDCPKIELLTTNYINSAKNYLLIVTPYFLPTDNILTALKMAAMRGVRIDICIPEKTDSIVMDYAARALFGKLLKDDINIYLMPPPFDHSKLLLADGLLLVTGSANWDERTFRLNFESNIECFSAELCEKVEKIIENKKKISKKDSLDVYENLPLWKVIRNNAFRLLSPYY